MSDEHNLDLPELAASEPAPENTAAPDAVPEPAPAAAATAANPGDGQPAGPAAPALPLLNDVEARVLGSLIEKQMATPEYYPLTLNSLLLACNQKNNRAPVMQLDDHAVARGLLGLQEKRLLHTVSLAGSRGPRYEHRVLEHFALDPGAQAVLCELLLRGPQTPGELRARAGRLSPFADLAAVQAALAQLRGTVPPLAVELPRAPGRKEARVAHAFFPAPVPAAPAEDAAAEPSVEDGPVPEAEPLQTPVTAPAPEEPPPAAAVAPPAPPAPSPALPEPVPEPVPEPAPVLASVPAAPVTTVADDEPDRLAALTAAVAGLQAEIAALRREVAALRREAR